MAGLCEGGNEPPCSLKVTRRIPNPYQLTTLTCAAYPVSERETTLIPKPDPFVRRRTEFWKCYGIETERDDD
ncbi:hypothetical protein ANN_08458 [Periplaneta americana]|uniref:Uncharacterized protein n=1 Tax=Periplaneta americana TaxID=6978 RepID=A0ABQ8T1H1_PERAM|nr:hypothetical protein ANN_08458 [Periplaneta americana]